MRTEAEQISDDTGLPLVDVLDMDPWSYPGSDADEAEGPRDADDFSHLGGYVPIEAPEWTNAEILNDSDPREHPREKMEERFDPEDG